MEIEESVRCLRAGDAEGQARRDAGAQARQFAGVSNARSRPTLTFEIVY
jgi:hypothetical protein